MAWCHEELKNPEWSQYRTEEIVATIDYVLKYGPEHLWDAALKRAKAIGYNPVVRRKAKSVKGCPGNG